jgi:hypothetical protein
MLLACGVGLGPVQSALAEQLARAKKRIEELETDLVQTKVHAAQADHDAAVLAMKAQEVGGGRWREVAGVGERRGEEGGGRGEEGGGRREVGGEQVVGYTSECARETGVGVLHDATGRGGETPS